ncbi:hypothetical protein QWY81_11250 [Polaribacter undariae]|uniref:SGNH hydrolase-type esterase domain-containing protein n=2 Tax=Polaribacter sejongensis TaxID=985043 RepID=A0AAJ1QXX4_9FLAO|nr:MULTISPECIES: GDSL-type esterase/lipase family protein [Polaribacter]MDN3620030.1 hypothetical protein [Polaribacter undariae]UWD31790.1 hypothetical protein NQP51_16860 [Polaribacter undariae]
MSRLILILLLCLGNATVSQEKPKFNDTQFVDFLENSLKKEVVTDAVRNSFYKESRTYWKDHKLDYNLHPEKYKKAMSLFHKNQDKFRKTSNTISIKRNDRIEKAVADFQNFDDKNSFPENSILFVGSSSIAGWKTSISFPNFFVINRGIGGMNMHEIIFHYNALIKKYNPSIIAIYCDIDIEQGKAPEEAVDVFKKLVEKIKTDFPKTPILLLSMKPVMVDDFIGKDIRKNKAIANTQLLDFSRKEKNVYFIDLVTPMLHADGTLKTDIFIQDGMHLNKLGYEIWNPIMRKKILELTNK